MITQDRLRILARELGVRQGYAEKNYLSQRESPALSVRRKCSDTCCRTQVPNRTGVNW